MMRRMTEEMRSRLISVWNGTLKESYIHWETTLSKEDREAFKAILHKAYEKKHKQGVKKSIENH